WQRAPARCRHVGCDAPVWTRPRRPELEDLALDLEDVARSCRLGPGDLSAGPDDSAGDGQAALHEQPHGDRCRVPAARHQSFKEVRTRGLGVDVKRLGVELPGERPDLLLVEPVRAAHKPLPDPQVFDGEGRWPAAWISVRHDGSLLRGRCSRNGYGAKDAACRATKSRALVAGLPRTASTSWVRRS